MSDNLVIEDEVAVNVSLKPPYENYTPLPGVVPPVESPKFGAHGQGRCKVVATRPTIPVPVTQEILHKQTVVEVDQTHITDKLQPLVYTQDVYHEVPQLDVRLNEVKVDVPIVKIAEVPTDVEVPVNIDYHVDARWKDRMVPRLFPKFAGKQRVIKVSFPTVELIQRVEESEVPIYVGEQFVEKEVVQEIGVEKTVFKYVLEEVEVPVYKYRPVFDVDVHIPKPVLLPMQVQPRVVDGGTNVISYEQYRKSAKDAQRAAPPRAAEGV